MSGEALRDRIFAINPWLLLLLPVLAAIFTLSQALVLRALGTPIGRINLGMGGIVWQRGVLAMRALPLGASVEVGAADDGGAAYRALGLGKKLGLLLSGPAVLALLAPALAQVHADLGLLCGGLAAVNLLPLPGLSGGQSLIALAEAASGQPLSGGVLGAWSLLGLLTVAGAVLWVFLA